MVEVGACPPARSVVSCSGLGDLDQNLDPRDPGQNSGTWAMFPREQAGPGESVTVIVIEGLERCGPDPREIKMMHLSVAEMFVNRLSVPLADEPADIVENPTRVSLFSGAATWVIAVLLGHRRGLPVLAAPVAQA